MSDDQKRPSGVLTRGDREFLQGKKEYQSPEAAINKRRDIRRRILNGILDFDLIESNLWEKDRRKIFEQVAEDKEEKRAFVRATEALLGWIYIGLKEGRFDEKRVFETAIEFGEGEIGISGPAKIVQSDVNLNIKTREIEGIPETLRKLESGLPVEAHQLYPLVRNDVSIDFSELEQVRIFASTNRIDGEKAVVESIFSDYYHSDVDVEIVSEDDIEKL